MYGNDNLLKHMLQIHMSKFVEQTAEKELMPGFWYYQQLAERMADAAFNVLASAAESQEMLREEGLLKD